MRRSSWRSSLCGRPRRRAWAGSRASGAWPCRASRSCGRWPPIRGGSCSSSAEPRHGRWHGWSATSRAESASWPRSAALADVVAELADGAVLDSRVLLADRLGADEHRWPAAEDRFASDLLRADGVADPWLRELTASAAAAAVPVLLGGHSLVGPGLPLLLRQDRGTVHSRGA